MFSSCLVVQLSTENIQQPHLTHCTTECHDCTADIQTSTRSIQPLSVCQSYQTHGGHWVNSLLSIVIMYSYRHKLMISANKPASHSVNQSINHVIASAVQCTVYCTAVIQWLTLVSWRRSCLLQASINVSVCNRQTDRQTDRQSATHISYHLQLQYSVLAWFSGWR